jgi:hypothetical protein
VTAKAGSDDGDDDGDEDLDEEEDAGIAQSKGRSQQGRRPAGGGRGRTNWADSGVGAGTYSVTYSK